MKKIISIIAAIAALSITSICVAAETGEATTEEINNDVVVISAAVDDASVDGEVATTEIVATAEADATATVIIEDTVTGSEREPVEETASDKGSPDTGVADVAGLAGIAVLAVGTLFVSKKR